MDDGPVDAETRPGPRLDREHVDPETFVDRHAFPKTPIEVGIDHELPVGDVCLGHFVSPANSDFFFNAMASSSNPELRARVRALRVNQLGCCRQAGATC